MPPAFFDLQESNYSYELHALRGNILREDATLGTRTANMSQTDALRSLLRPKSMRLHELHLPDKGFGYCLRKSLQQYIV